MPDDAAQIRLKMIRYRAWHRGFREADLILGGFANQRLEQLSAAQVDEFEALLEHPDQLLYAWIVGQETPPEAVLCEVFYQLQQFRIASADGGQSSV